MANYYINKGFSVERLEAVKHRINDNLSDIGKLYNGNFENMTAYQKHSQTLNNQGYEYAEQIHDLYSEMGAVLQALESKGV